MNRKHAFFWTALVLTPLNLNAIELLKDYLDYSDEHPPPNVANDLVYGEGTTEVTSQINEYENIVANQPIQGSIFVTHDAKNSVDVSSFRLGDKALKVTFVKSSQMSSVSPIVVSIYNFQLDGMPIGSHTMPSINVKVGGALVQALPLIINIQQ
ncbi:MAG: hypothetical protein WCG42_00445 [Parachlamydiaceae bacterium]